MIDFKQRLYAKYLAFNRRKRLLLTVQGVQAKQNQQAKNGNMVHFTLSNMRAQVAKKSLWSIIEKVSLVTQSLNPRNRIIPIVYLRN